MINTAKYKLKKIQQPRWLLASGDIVVGEEVDEHNQLHYIIQKGTGFVSIKANGMRPVANLIPSPSATVTMRNGTIEKVIEN